MKNTILNSNAARVVTEASLKPRFSIYSIFIPTRLCLSFDCDDISDEGMLSTTTIRFLKKEL